MIVGGGVFVTTGLIAGQHAGPAISISYMLASIIIILMAFCYAELHSLIPSGGVYSYSYVIFGEVVAWIVISVFFLATMLGCCFVAIGFSEYLVDILLEFSIYTPIELQHGYGTEILINGETRNGLFNLPAAILIILSTFILLRSVRVASSINNALVLIKISVILGFVICGFMYIDSNLWVPYVPDNSGTLGEFGWSGVIIGASLLFPAYNGFDVILSASPEAKYPKKDVPRAIISCIFISAVLYCITAVIMTGLVDYRDLSVAKPMSLALERIPIPYFALMMKIGVMVALFSVEIMSIYSITRIVLVAVEDGLLPKALGKIDKRFAVPRNLTISVSLIIFVVVNSISIKEIIEMQALGLMGIFTLVCMMTLCLRYTRPDDYREFSMPMIYIIVPIICGIFAFVMILEPYRVWKMMMIYLSGSLMIYLCYGIRHSRLS